MGNADCSDALWDAVVLGGGASGLSLACHLAHAGWGERVAIVDDGSYPLADRSWAWWSRGEGLLDAQATNVFDYLDAAGSDWHRRTPMAPYAYRSITGARLSDATDAVIGTLPGYVRIAGRATAVTHRDNGAIVSVENPAGRVDRLCARWVFDSVGVGMGEGKPEVRPAPLVAPHLDFLGLHVESERDVFDPTAITLMDFRTGQSDGVAFVYVLPTSARTALVERTTFVHPDAGEREAPHHEQQLATYLREVLTIPDASVTGREQGVIPLVTHGAVRRRGCVIPIGAQAGMVRASTGYAFERIQGHSEEIARRLISGRDPGSSASAEHWPRILDAALLRVIREDPDAVRMAFAAMFARHPAARTLAFLDGRASLAAQARILTSLPLARFAAAQATGTIAAWKEARRPHHM